MNTETFYAILFGLLLGLILGLLKTWLIWYINSPFNKSAKKEPSVQRLLLRSFISYLSTILIIVLVYFGARSYISLPLIPLVLAASTGVIVCGFIYPLQNMFRK